MLDVIEKLLTLQERDRRMRRLSGEMAHLEPQRQMLRGKAVSAQAALDNIKTKLKQIENLGVSLARQGRTDEAIARFRAALEADPKNTAAQQALAQALAGGGRAGEAPAVPPAQ